MADISHTGATVILSASRTFPGAKLTLTSFPKDVDPIEIEDIEIADAEMGTNGDFISWSTANVINVTLSVIPFSADHELLSIILNANRIEKLKISPITDIIQLVRVLPNGETTTLINGKLISGPPSTSLQGSGRVKTVSFKFRFGEMVRTPAITSAIS